MVALSAAQERNYREAFATTRSWASAHGKDPAPLLDRVAMVLLTESNGRNYANDGLAYADNAEKVRPGWAEGIPLPQRATIRGVLRKSLDMLNDGVGNNGGSTGVCQQLSQEFVAVRFPGKTWGYGTVAATMDVGNAVTMFLGRLVVTDNPDYAGITFSDPLVADVLRVQQPKISEQQSDNYNASQVATAKAIVAQLTDTKDGFDMAEVKDVTNAVHSEVTTPLGSMDGRLSSVEDDVAVIKRWIKGGYQGPDDDFSQTNIAGTWQKADAIVKMLAGGYAGTKDDSNIAGIWYMLWNLCHHLMPDVERPDRDPNKPAGEGSAE